jgi:hypothetical protein
VIERLDALDTTANGRIKYVRRGKDAGASDQR